MAKKSKKKADQVPEAQEENLNQVEDSVNGDDLAEKSQDKDSQPPEKEQVEGPQDAPESQEAKQAEVSPDDLLAEVRQEMFVKAKEAEAKQGFFDRVRNKLKKPSETEAQADVTGLEMRLVDEGEEEEQKAQEELLAALEKSKKKKRVKKQDKEAIQEFFSDLEALAEVEFDERLGTHEDAPVPVEETLEEPAEEIIEESSGEQPGVPSEEEKPEDEAPSLPPPVPPEQVKEVDPDELREVALEDFDGTVTEVEIEPELQEEVRQTIRELRPNERLILIIAGIIAVATMLAAGVSILTTSISAIPTPVPTEAYVLQGTIYPTRLILPGGWEFDLIQGQVVDGTWTPKSAEWLVGTEISRWVALPWTLQLEAVLRTLTSEDQIKLTMSNYRVLTFNVSAIDEYTMRQIQSLDPTKPGLIVVLFSDEPSASHWVVEAVPAPE